MRFLLILIVSFFVCVPSISAAQETAIPSAEISASGQEYLKVIRYRGVDPKVVYFDPSQPAPPLDTQFEPQAQREPASVDIDSQWVVGLISVLVLITLAVIVYSNAKNLTVSFATGAGNAKRDIEKTSADDTPSASGIPDLDAILRQTDRDQAVIGLTQLVLGRCLAANQVLFKRSWTHREALRSLPDGLWYLADLRALVLESEKVNFGHRSISSQDFNALLARARPILREIPA